MAIFKNLAGALNKPLAMSPPMRSALVQYLLQQSGSPQGIVSPYGTANKALQGLLMRRATIADRQENETRQDRQQGLAGALSRTNQGGAQGEAARRAAMIIAGGLPDDPVAQQLLQGQAKGLTGSGERLIGVANPGDFEPASLAKYQKSGDPGDLVPRENIYGRYTPSQYTAESWAKFKISNDPADLVLRPEFRFVQTPSGAPVAGNTLTGEVGATSVTPEAAIDEAARRKEAEAGATASAERYATQISDAYDAVRALPVIHRGLDLLDEGIKTGGINRAKLALTEFAGVTGANETELSSNLGKAVLSQLRATFGAQFTEREGERLSRIEAGFGRSTEGNKRLLEEAKEITERAVRRGITAAKQSDNSFDAEELEKALEYRFSYPNEGATPNDITPLLDKYAPAR